MAFPDRVPNELWDAILKNVWDEDDFTARRYSLSVLTNFSLACHIFHRISRPHIFSDFQFTPYGLDDDGAILLPSRAEVDRCLERLAFFSSTEIAPFVRYCNISARESWECSFSSRWFATDSAYILLDALFSRLGLFPGLQRLHAMGIHFTQARVDILCRLQSLYELNIYWCPVAPGEHIQPSPRTLRISKFTMRHFTRTARRGDDYWISLLDPDHLHILHADFDPRFMGLTAHHIPRFPDVHTLTATINLPTLSETLTIMSKFPFTTMYMMRFFPLLKEYSGPHRALPFFHPAIFLTRLHITERCRPEDLIARLQGIQAPNITTFQATFHEIDNTTFSKLIELLPRLTEALIRVVVRENDELGSGITPCFKPSTFFGMLAETPSLPSRLEHLGISWEGYDRLHDHVSTYEIPDFTRVRDTVLEKCPRLSWLWLNDFCFLFEWRNPLSDGSVKEVTTKNFDDTHELLEDVEIFRHFHDW
ncbi:hypothetical protein B0H14DRAFT_3128158 [Mycena olivaceomarginata]|nr:hypothetical protein B0H14DRAFT_3128158 [Mycena olivaceomarginata]